jgi:hypothetical protein
MISSRIYKIIVIIIIQANYIITSFDYSNSRKDQKVGKTRTTSVTSSDTCSIFFEVVF